MSPKCVSETAQQEPLRITTVHVSVHALHLFTLKTVQLFQDSVSQNVPILNSEIQKQELV